MNEVTELPWDSNFFGFGVGKVIAHNMTSNLLKKILLQMKSQKYKLVYCFVDPKDEISNKSLSKKYELVDKKVTFVIPISKIKKVSKNVSSYFQKPVNNHLVYLALLSGEYSRFKIDKHFGVKAYERLYTKWLENSLNGTIARDVLVYSENDREVGLLTLGEKNGRADIGLLAVDEKYQGRGIGTKLINAAMKKSQEMDFQKIQVVTQIANRGACLFYEKVGFIKERVENIYHIWL